MTIEPVPYKLMGETAWNMLTEAANEMHHPMRIVTMATVDASLRPQARLMTVRGANRELATLWFHTDTDSKKFHELHKHPRASLVAYAPRMGVQLRINVRTKLHTDNAIAHDHWEQVNMSLRHHFGAPVDGAALPFHDPRLDRLWHHHEPDASVVDRQRFAVIEARVTSIDWLQTVGARQWAATLPTIKKAARAQAHPPRVGVRLR